MWGRRAPQHAESPPHRNPNKVWVGVVLLVLLHVEGLPWIANEPAKRLQREHLFLLATYVYTETYKQSLVYTGCLLGLGTNPDRLLGLGTLSYYRLTILGQNTYFAMFSMSLVCVCVVGTFALILCYNSAYIPGF